VKVKIFFLAMLAVLAAFAIAASRPAAVDFSGTWLGKTEVPGSGIDELTLVLKKDKESYTGTVVDSLQMIVPWTEIQNVKVEGNVITLMFPLTDGNMISCTLTLAGGKMTGDWIHPEGSTGTIDFDKKE
jgi:hypothetical protein